MAWNAIGIARGSNGDDEQIDEMLEKAYRKGYKKAMEEMHEGYGERGGYSGGGRGGYGMREPWKEDYDYGERRGVRGTGPYSRYRRR